MEVRSDGEQKFQIIAALFVIAVISLSAIFFLNSYIVTEHNRFEIMANPVRINHSGDFFNETSEEVVKGASTNELVCVECRYFPVDKENSLSKNYLPEDIIPIDLLGGGMLNKYALSDLQPLFEEAFKENLEIKVVSSYRSYTNQIETFKYWVNQEKLKGLSEEEAEIKANVYSAREGHSEHQLGTTVDLACKNCNAFDNSVENLKVYKFLEENAYKYGFVISYPKGKESLTGYKYEPWHIRYVGKELATEFYNMGYLYDSYNYLSKFLTDKHLWK